MIYGRSVHNQRIERLWRDVFTGTLVTYYNLFYKLEDDNMLDINKPTHMYCLHFVFLTRINEALAEWKMAWGMHRMRTTGMTPHQMFVLSTSDDRLRGVSFLCGVNVLISIDSDSILFYRISLMM